MDRKLKNSFFRIFLVILALCPLLFVTKPIVALCIESFTALLRSWGVLPGIGQVFLNTLKVLGMTLLIALPLSALTTLWMYEYVHGKRLKRLQNFLHGLSRIPAVLVGLLGNAIIFGSEPLHKSVYTMAGLLVLLAFPFTVSRMDAALRAVPDKYMKAGMALGGRRMEVLRMVVLPRAKPALIRTVLELTERLLSETTALLMLMGTVMPGQVLSTELFRLAWLGRRDAAVLALFLLVIVVGIRLMTTRRWRIEGEEQNCRYNW